MNNDSKRQPKPVAPPATGAESTTGSGEGASTALEALIRKRKQVETPDGSHHSPAPQQPPAPR